ncbi:MAG TPA: SsrA-binding protein SmpB [Campylobacterales bacterium]|nr:SsrA-binding protein SmpB [Campylobacterales bacterium]
MKQYAGNKKAYHDYHILDKLEAGISLIGSEAKAIRSARVNLKDGFVRIINGEAFLFGMHVSHLSTAVAAYKPSETRDRKLLLHKKQILKLTQRVKEDGLTIVPISVYANDRNKIKIEIALAKGKQQHDKRESMKEKDAKLEIARAMKRYD